MSDHRKRVSRLIAGRLSLCLLLSGCANLQPDVPGADPQIPAAWPVAGSSDTASAASENVTLSHSTSPATTKPATQVSWHDFFLDQRLVALLTQALASNRDARVALLNVERARALYSAARADTWPAPTLNAAITRGEPASATGIYTSSVGLTSFELDLFGRLHSLSQSALHAYLAQEAARRSTELSLIAEVATAWFTLALDQELQHIARNTLENRQKSLTLDEHRYRLGAVSELDLAEARTAIETARSDLARYTGQVMEDLNALTLLVGSPIAPSLLPHRFDVPDPLFQGLSAGLPSDILLSRPDVMQAEQKMRAANAEIGAARAAFFPSISLTTSIGYASAALSALFSGGSRAWTFIPQISVPIFQREKLWANLAVSQADRDIALAEYEKAIQTGFKEVANALAWKASLDQQRTAQEALLTAATQAERLSRLRYEQGRDNYIVLLDTERTLYSAQQSLAQTRWAQYNNQITLYKVLGGSWTVRPMPDLAEIIQGRF
ncbi:MAG: efflux transporter outer membrane subunit [Alcaligenaceae bacterium]|nr:efflux transporter outer membrane subunit [Alcaligenaceae bacterium]